MTRRCRTVIVSPGRSRQHGLTLLGFLFVFGLIGFLTLLVVRIGPIYFDHYLVLSSLESLQDDENIATRTREEIVGLLQKRWDINNVKNIRAKDVRIQREQGRLTIELTYDVSEPIMGNLDVLVHFDDVVEIESDQ